MCYFNRWKKMKENGWDDGGKGGREMEDGKG